MTRKEVLLCIFFQHLGGLDLNKRNEQQEKRIPSRIVCKEEALPRGAFEEILQA
jgi:hypothetical protein